MNQSQFGTQLLEFLKKLSSLVMRFVHRHTIPIIASAVLVLIAWQSWQAYRELRNQHVTFLIGGTTGSSSEEARLIQKEFEMSNGVAGKAYSLRLTHSNGYEENRNLISEDIEGRMVGFAYDGFGESRNVAIILPLDKRYLHILCAKSYYETIRRLHWPANSQRNLVQPLFEGLGKNPGSVYLGTRGSATRQCAEIVLKHFKVEPDEVRCFGVGGFEEMRAALSLDHIKMAFSSGKFNSETIAEIAKDNKAVLLGLDGHRDAIIQANPHLIPVDFKSNSYAAGEFCSDHRKAVGARRVMICSKNMSPQDAYFIGKSTVRALRDRMPEIEWETSPPSADPKSAPLRYQLHPGALAIRENREPIGNSQWLTVFLITGGVWIGAEFLRWMNTLIPSSNSDTQAVPEQPPQPPATPDDETSKAYMEIRRQIEDQIHELERAAVPLAKREHTAWQRRIDQLHETILIANRDGNLSPQRTRTLMTGLYGELLYEHDLRKPVKSGSAKSAKVPSKTS